MVTGWRCWYTDGRVFQGQTYEDWCRLPDDGVLVVMVYFADGTRRVEQGDDWYWSTPEGLHCHDTRQSSAEIEARYPGASIKRGMWTSDEDMRRVTDEALS